MFTVLKVHLEKVCRAENDRQKYSKELEISQVGQFSELGQGEEDLAYGRIRLTQNSDMGLNSNTAAVGRELKIQ